MGAAIQLRSDYSADDLRRLARARRKFYELATLKKAPIAIEAVRRIDELFAIEREISKHTPRTALCGGLDIALVGDG